MLVDVDEQTGTVFMYPKVMENYHPKPTDEEMASSSAAANVGAYYQKDGAVNLADFEVSSDEGGAAPPGGFDGGYNGY